MYVSLAKSRAGWQPDAPAALLKGKALDAALEAANLPRVGTADEKRAALAAHEAELPVALPPEASADPATSTTNPDGGSPASQPEEG